MDIVKCKNCIHHPSVNREVEYPGGIDLTFPDNVCPFQYVEDEYFAQKMPDDFYCAYGEEIKIEDIRQSINDVIKELEFAIEHHKGIERECYQRSLNLVRLELKYIINNR